MRIEVSQSNLEWGSVVLSFDNKERRFALHVPSGEVFNDDPISLIRSKCLALVVLTPLITIVRSIAWLVQSFFLLLQESFYILDGQPSEEINEERVKTFEDSGRAITYGFWMTAHAFAGIKNPLIERKQYGALERELNRQLDGPHLSKYYLAFCFQRLCVLPSDSAEHSAVEARLIRYLTRVKAIKNASWMELIPTLQRLQNERAS